MQKNNFLFLILILFILSCESEYSNLDYYHSIGYPKNVSENYVIANADEKLEDIAVKYQVNHYELAQINNIKPPYKLYEGQKIYLPKFKIHIVKDGETLYKISHDYSVEMGIIAKANNIKHPFKVTKGKPLKIPQNFVSKGELDKINSLDAKTYESAPKPNIVKHNLAHNIPSFENNYNITELKEHIEKNKEVFNDKKTNKTKVVKKEKVAHKLNFTWPIKGGKVIDYYGQKAKGIKNDGINISAKNGTEVYAAENGKIVYSGKDLEAYGNLIIIMHENGYATSYAHLSSMEVEKGMKVKKGDLIGKVGSTGIVKSPQLHFSLRKGKKAINPINHLG